MTVKQLLAVIDSREIAEWMVLDDLENWKKKLDEKGASKPPTAQKLFSTLFKKSIKKR